MTSWAVGPTGIVDGLSECLYEIFDASPTEGMVTLRLYGFLSHIIAYLADENLLASPALSSQKEIWMIGNLSHLHNEPEDVGVIVQHDALSDIVVKLPSR